MKYQTLRFILGIIFLSVSFLFIFQDNSGSIKTNSKTSSATKKEESVLPLPKEDAYVVNFIKDRVHKMDALNSVATEHNPYDIRLARIVKKHLAEDGLKLNFKVYDLADANALSCADGSIRVFTGLMDIMTDEELLGIIGHEIGHVKNEDSKHILMMAYIDSVAQATTLSNSVEGLSMSESGMSAPEPKVSAFTTSQFCQVMEVWADDYGFDFLKRHNYNLAAMGTAFRKLQKFEEENYGNDCGIMQFYSSHPDIRERAEKMEKKARELESR